MTFLANRARRAALAGGIAALLALGLCRRRPPIIRAGR